jgi:uncharacterized protein YejL (UPF0352 family)
VCYGREIVDVIGNSLFVLGNAVTLLLGQVVVPTNLGADVMHFCCYLRVEIRR